jgi:hypothetical protein
VSSAGTGRRRDTAKAPVTRVSAGLADSSARRLLGERHREILPPATARAVVTVGTIHGGLKRNIIPDEVKLELTLRAFDPADHGEAGGVRPPRRRRHGAGRRRPEDRMPVVTMTEETVGVDGERSGR